MLSLRLSNEKYFSFREEAHTLSRTVDCSLKQRLSATDTEVDTSVLEIVFDSICERLRAWNVGRSELGACGNSTWPHKSLCVRLILKLGDLVGSIDMPPRASRLIQDGD